MEKTPDPNATSPSTSPASRPTLAVILAGGKGMRANPQTFLRNKCLFSVHNHSLIENQIAIIRDKLAITDIIVIVGHLKDQVKAALGDGARLGVYIRYVDVRRIEDGPAIGLLEAREYLDRPFFVFLGDEYHHFSRHDRMLEVLDRQPDAVVTYTKCMNPHQILANFSVQVEEDGRLSSLIEKPQQIINEFCGCGTLYLTPGFLDAIERMAPSARSGRVELFEVVDSLIGDGRVLAVDLDDPDYVNINTLDDLRRAIFTYRSENFPRFSISVIVPAWNEAQSVEYVVKDFLNQPGVTEVLVMDNLSPDGTGEIARRAGARVISERLTGYGDAIHKGLNAAKGDVLVVVEADYSFRAADMPKLLEYLKDADFVIGTRTTRQLIYQGANMPFMARAGNILMAKYMEVLWFWLKLRFSDVGCTYRAIWRSEWQAIEPRITMTGPGFAVEMMIELFRQDKICIEVPVSYHQRFGGESKHSKDFLGLSQTACQMWRVITRRWLATVGNIIKNRLSPTKK